MRTETIYKCPVCQSICSTHEAAKACRDSHHPIVEQWTYCEICGAGWNMDYHSFGEAQDCERKHHEKGEADTVACRTFFISGGRFGYHTPPQGEKP